MDFKDLFTSRNIIIFIIVLILIIAIFYYSRGKRTLERMSNYGDSGASAKYPTAASGDAPFKTSQTTNLDKPDASATTPDRSAPTNPQDLLPSSTGANWGNLYPVQNDNGVYVPSMIDPSFAIGINTISSTMKNPNLDLRSEIPIPKKQLSPWNNSSWQPNVEKIGLDPSPSTMA
jgi:hypothetical protein